MTIFVEMQLHKSVLSTVCRLVILREPTPSPPVFSPPPRLVKAQCIRFYGFLMALLHVVGSYIQMQLLIGRLPSCQLFSIVC